MWVVHIPVIERRTGIGHPTLGLLLLLLVLGALAGMRSCGHLVDRFGSRPVVTIAAMLSCLGITGPGLAASTAALAPALMLFGFAAGALDVSMNAHAVAVERSYRRPIMSAFHAVFSLGGVAAAVAGAEAIRLGLGLSTTMIAVCASGMAVATVASLGLLGDTRQARRSSPPASPRRERHGDTGGGARGDTSGGAHWDTSGGAHWDTSGGAHWDTSGGAHWDTSGGAHWDTSGGACPDTGWDVHSDARGNTGGGARGPARGNAAPDARGPARGNAAPDPRGRARGATWRRTGDLARTLGALCMLAFLLMLAEGVAYDWATVDLRDMLGAPPATAALGYGTFALAMTAGRLGCDRLAARLGPVFVLRWGALLAAAGLTGAALAPWLPMALLGWAAFGIGLAGGVPQVFTAAGNVAPAAAGVNISWVAGTGYAGLLTGPAVIGAATRVVPLNVALLLPVICCLAAAGYAGRAHRGTPAFTAVAGPRQARTRQ
jgi:MFS family permease